jgi:DNA-binding NarL/FixJ family response regulator
MEERTPPLFHVCVIEKGLASDVGCELRTLVNVDASRGRILIADGHPIFRDGLRRLLETEADFEVIGDAGDVAGTLQLVRQLDPDVLLLDVSLTQVGRSDVLRALAAAARLPRTILLADRIAQEQLITLLRLGVRGVVLREATTTKLLCDSIRSVLRNHYALGPEQVRDLVRAMVGSADGGITSRNPFRLTRRQLDIVAAVAIGETNKEVARHFSISEETVKRHLSSIFDKLGVFSRLELAIFALNHGLIDNDAS